MHLPVASYRVQLHHAFTFEDVHALTPYLDDLGVSDLYVSPILTARQGSTHGYDICDHGAINPELGSRDAFSRLSADLRARRLGLIVDFVPNHMGIDPQTNAWWRDVLTHGPQSEYAAFFDIDWSPIKPELRDKVLLPVLGDQYGAVLERGELQLALVNGALVLNYFDRQFPTNPRHAPMVFGWNLNELAARLGADRPAVATLREILGALGEARPDAGARLAALATESPEVARHLDEALAHFNGTPGDAASFDALHALLERQAYRLAYWRTAFDEINYRRFFDINELAGLRMEDARVFDATHELLLELVHEGSITGIRLDHPDGLFDPQAYFDALAAAVGGPEAVYIVVEKILGHGEQLRDSWPVHGTTGYNFLNTINGVFVHADGLTRLKRAYRRFSGRRQTAVATEYASKRLMMRTTMASELNVLASALNRISETDRRYRDFTLNSLRRALMSVIACFPVYRTYVTSDGAQEEDVAVVDAAISEARRRNPLQEPSIFEFIREVLLPPAADGAGAAGAGERWRTRTVAFAQRFQQYTAPVVAKGVEDTAFYNDVLLISANEVGGDLSHRARTIAELHRDNLARLAQWPLEMTAGSTHDTKRGEDARARINVLTEFADEWLAKVTRWAAINDDARSRVGAVKAPDRNDEWLFYQALVGAWPAEAAQAEVPSAAPAEFVERMQAFMIKSVKEAKRHTSWVTENQEYEQAVKNFVEASLTGPVAGRFLASFVPFQRRVAWFGMVNALAQSALRLGSPGVPDIYQGTELWNFSLVDPDNRRPVDYPLRVRLLEDVQRASLPDLLEQWTDGRAKLFTLTRALRFRRDHAALLLHGEYTPLTDDDDEHLIAFSRRHEREELIVVVPRFLATLMRGTPGTSLGGERWRAAGFRLPRRLAGAQLTNIFTGDTMQPLVHRDLPWLLAADAFRQWPVAWLHVSQRPSD